MAIYSLEESLSCLPQGLVRNRKDPLGWLRPSGESAIGERPGIGEGP